MIESSSAVWQAILESASHAPSADNHSHFLLEHEADTVRIKLRNSADAQLRNYRRKLLMLNLGTLVENIIVTASRFGLTSNIHFAESHRLPNTLVEISWLRNPSEVADSLTEAIAHRHTNRKFYHGPDLPMTQLAELEAQVTRISGCHLKWLDHRAVRAQALRLMRMAETERFRNPYFHAEMFSAIRFDIGWNQSCNEGLPPGALEVEKLLRLPFQLMAHWPVMRAANLFGMHFLMGWRAAWLPGKTAPHLGIIYTAEDTDQDTFSAGRAFQRLWLQAALNGLALQPMPASVLYRDLDSTIPFVMPGLSQALGSGWKAILEKYKPQMLFRMGHAPPPLIRTAKVIV